MSEGSTPNVGSDKWPKAWHFSLFVLVLFFAAYPEILLGTHAFSYRDAALFGHPLAHYFRESFWRGEIPLWNPLNDCGLPFLAQWNTLVLYPPSLIYLLLPMPYSMSLYCVAHVLLGALGAYYLARRWTQNPFAASVAGLAFGINGLTLHSLMWPNNIAALGWMPWVLLAAELAMKNGGRGIVIAGFAAALQLLSGAPEIILFTWFILAGFWLVNVLRREGSFHLLTMRMVLIALLAGGLSAAQLLPFLDLLRHSHRDSSFGGDTWAMPAWGLANFFVPLFRCTPSVTGVYSQDEQQWTSSYYVGIGTLVFAFLAVLKSKDPKARLLTGITLAGLVLSLGKSAFILERLREALPLFGFIRFPIKFVVLTVFGLPLLAAFGIDAWQKAPRSFARLFSGINLFVLFVIITIASVAFFFPFPGDTWEATRKSAISRGIFAVMIAAGFFLQANAADDRRRQITSLAVLGLIGFDILTHAPRQNPASRVSAYQPMTYEMAKVPRHGESRAMVTALVNRTMSHAANPDPVKLLLGQRSILLCNLNLLDGIPKVDGFFSLYLRDIQTIERRIATGKISEGLLDFLGVSQITSPSVLFGWESRTNFLPLITTGQKPLFVKPDETVDRMFSDEFDPRKEVFLPEELKSSVTCSNQTVSKIISSRIDHQRIGFEVHAAEPSLVVLAQAFYHPWRAYVDGVRTPLWKANHAFQALLVPAGNHQVEIKYEDKSFLAGALISGLTLLCGAFFGIRVGIKRDTSPSPE